MKTMADRIVRFRWVIIIGFILLTVFFARQIPRAEIDADVKGQLPEDMVSRVNVDRIDELFGGTEIVLILLQNEDVLERETLLRVKKLSKKVARVDGVDKVLSLFDLKSIKGEDGAMIVDPAVKRIPRSDQQKEILRQELQDNDLVYGSVVSKDFTVTTVIAVLENDVNDAEIIPAIQNVMDDVPGKEPVSLGGLPYIRNMMSTNIQNDMRRLMPYGILIMLVFLFVCFRQLRGVLLPFFVVIMSILVAMGLIPFIGWKIQVITVILPVFLIAVANDYGIHLIAKYQEYNTSESNDSPQALAKRIFMSLSRPVLLAGITTMVGMLCLLGHVLVPARQLGILAALGIVFALGASLLFIPAMISLLPRSKPIISVNPSPKEKKHILEKLLWFFGGWISRHPRAILIGAVILCLLVSTGIFSIVVDTDPAGYYDDNHPIVQTTDLIDEHLGGSQNVSVVFKGDIKDPVIMTKIDSMEQVMVHWPEVGHTTSVARVLRQMSRALNDPHEAMYNEIPMTRNGIAQYFELYAMSGDAEDFEKMVDFPYEHALLTGRLNTTSTSELRHVVNKVEALAEEDPHISLVGGFGVVLTDLARLVVNGQILSLVMATVLVAVLMMLLFRSFVAGLISAVPMLLSMIVLFGLMGLFGIELNIATAMLSSIMIGVGIDYTIHFLWRYREERHNGLSPADGVLKTLTTTGRGIVFNAFSVIIGFVVLFLSTFLPVKFFGFLVVVTIFACLIGALILVPAMCMVFRPRFLEPGTNDR